MEEKRRAIQKIQIMGKYSAGVKMFPGQRSSRPSTTRWGPYPDGHQEPDPFHDGTVPGGYCQTRITQLMEQELGMAPEELRYQQEGGWLFTGRSAD